METTLGWPIWIGVVVDDLEAAKRFWGDLLGMTIDHEGKDYASFLMPDGRWFEFVERSDDPEYDSIRFQVAFEVEDIEASVAALEARSIQAIAGPFLDHEEPWAYFRDREGNVFAIKQRR